MTWKAVSQGLVARRHGRGLADCISLTTLL
jgi:hypothetical protein